MLHIGEVSVDFSRFSRQFSVIITMEADIAPVEECRSLSVKSGQHFDCLAQRKCDRYWLTDRQTDRQTHLSDLTHGKGTERGRHDMIQDDIEEFNMD